MNANQSQPQLFNRKAAKRACVAENLPSGGCIGGVWSDKRAAMSFAETTLLDLSHAVKEVLIIRTCDGIAALFCTWPTSAWR